jgi:1-acyl-sn-glycerol-3-phosphate acyltransferase
MGLSNIEHTPVRYRLLYGLANLFFRVFYRRITITGKHHIPKGEQLIFASNHQNALMDALAMLFAYGKPVVFLARADIFKKQRIARLLYFLKILPVFRPRDGAETMNQNYETFARTSRVLKAGVPIAILPEGTHSPIKKLQPLKKGICRIAFLTAESQDFKSDILIVPAGIDYTHYSRAGTELLVNYGEPIHVAEYYALYRENPQKAILQLRDRLAAAIKPLMIHVEQEEYYHTIQQLLLINRENRGKPEPGENKRGHHFAADRDFIGRLDRAAAADPALLPALEKACTSYFNLLSHYKLRDRLFHPPQAGLLTIILQALFSLLLLPVHLAGMIFNYLPYKLPVIFTKKVKDKQFLSSLHYGLGLVFFFFWYLIAGIVLGLTTGNPIITISVLIFLAAAGIFSFYHYIRLKLLIGRFRLLMLKNTGYEEYHHITAAREAILQLLKNNGLSG